MFRKDDVGLVVTIAAVAALMLVGSWVKDREHSLDEAKCRYGAEVMKLDAERAKVAIAYCMQEKGWR